MPDLRASAAANRVDATRNRFVLRRGWIELGDLIDDDIFDESRRRLRRALHDVNVPAVGGFDNSLNEHETEDFAPYWAPHGFFLVPSWPPARSVGKCSNASPDFHPEH